MNHPIAKEEISPQPVRKKEYQSPIVCKLDGNEIHGGQTNAIAENTSGGGWIVSGS